MIYCITDKQTQINFGLNLLIVSSDKFSQCK